MGNNQSHLKSHLKAQNNLIFSSKFTLRQISNMPPDGTAQKKKCQENNNLSNILSIPLQQRRERRPSYDYLDVKCFPYSAKAKPVSSQFIKEKQIRDIQASSAKIALNDADSLRMTHIDAETKKSQLLDNNHSILNRLSCEEIKNHKSMISKRTSQKLKSSLSDGNPQISKCLQGKKEDLQKLQRLENKQVQNQRIIPSAIDDLDTIQLNQSNQGIWMQNTLYFSHDTDKEIRNSEYQRRGRFLITDTDEGFKENKSVNKKIKIEQVNKEYQLGENQEYDDIRTSQCECNFMQPLLRIFLPKFPKRQISEETQQSRNTEIQTKFQSKDNNLIAQVKENNLKVVEQDQQKIKVSKTY